MSPPNKHEMKYYGVNAVLAVFAVRPHDVVKVLLLESRKRELAPLLKWCAAEKKAYRFVYREDLDRLTASTHHEGVCLVARRRDALELAEAVKNLRPGPVLFLDGVENPHNFGSILRAAAHFRAGLVAGERKRTPQLSASACRVSEGGAEHVTVAVTDDPKRALRNFRKKGYVVVSTSSRAERSLYEYKFSRDTVIVLGAEDRGVDAELNLLADVSISIPGSGAVESLNVSSACSVLLSEYSRQQWKR